VDANKILQPLSHTGCTKLTLVIGSSPATNAMETWTKTALESNNQQGFLRRSGISQSDQNIG
jgi:hypothetical protein